METREIEFRLDQLEERTMTGLAVPYGEDYDLGSYKERFAPGAIRSVDDVKIFYGHEHRDLPIGKVIAGLPIRARKSNKFARSNPPTQP